MSAVQLKKSPYRLAPDKFKNRLCCCVNFKNVRVALSILWVHPTFDQSPKVKSYSRASLSKNSGNYYIGDADLKYSYGNGVFTIDSERKSASHFSIGAYEKKTVFVMPFHKYLSYP